MLARFGKILCKVLTWSSPKGVRSFYVMLHACSTCNCPNCFFSFHTTSLSLLQELVVYQPKFQRRFEDVVNLRLLANPMATSVGKNKIRLRLSITRHELPQVKILHTIDISQNPTISELISQIDELVPLESGSWGKEDYVVSVGAFECVHFQTVNDILRNDDEVT